MSYGTVADLGEKLRELLYQNDMSMETVNATIEREHVQDTHAAVKYFPPKKSRALREEHSEIVLGGWKTEAQLELQPGWDSCWAHFFFTLAACPHD